MKRITLLLTLFVLLVVALPTLAQNNPDLITLNVASPAIDVVITLPPDSTGTISLDVALAAITVTDGNNAVVFSAADVRLHGLEFNIAPNSGTHTLTVERLPGVAEAYVSVVSLPEMTMNGVVNLIEGREVTFNQETALTLDSSSPGGTIAVNIPEETVGVLTTTFPGAHARTQLIDSDGLVLAESVGGHIDGLTFVLDSGDYDFTVLGSDLADPVIVGVRAVSDEEGGFMVIETPTNDQITTISTGSDCTATITSSSANLRSGPGTGYSVLNYGYRGQTFVVGGQNPENNWLVVGTSDGGSAWVSKGIAQLQGGCDALTVFNIPLRDAAPAQIIITSPGSNPSYEHEDEHEDEHEHEDDDHYEHDDDD